MKGKELLIKINSLFDFMINMHFGEFIPVFKDFNFIEYSAACVHFFPTYINVVVKFWLDSSFQMKNSKKI